MRTQTCSSLTTEDAEDTEGLGAFSEIEHKVPPLCRRLRSGSGRDDREV